MNQAPPNASRSNLAEVCAPPLLETPGWARIVDDLPREHGFRVLDLVGRVPPDLRGTLYRNGPARSRSFDPVYHHHFDGDGAVTAVRFEEEGISGAVHVHETPGLVVERRVGRRLYNTFATPSPVWWRRIGGRIKNAANTSILAWQNRTFALCEGGPPVEFDPHDLTTIGETDLEGVVPMTFSAHPHTLPEREAIYNFGVRYGPRCKLDLFELPFRGKARRLASLPLRGAPLVHDFIVTSRYLVFLAPPVRLEALPFVLGLGSLHDRFHWVPTEGTEVIVVPIDEPSRPIRFEVDPFFQWHFANAFESNNEIVLDFIRFPDFSSIDQLLLDEEVRPRTNDAPGSLHRVRIQPGERTFRSEPVWERSCEFPVLSPQWAGTNYQYLYLTSHSDAVLAEAGPWDQLAKLDIHSGVVQEVSLGEHRYPSEALFVPRPQSRGEDDGYLVTLVYDAIRHASYVAVLDARDLEGGVLCEAWFDQHIPLTFHGIWVADGSD